MNVDNGRRVRLEIAGVFEGLAGVQGNRASFVPNRSSARPESVKGGILDGQNVRLVTTRDGDGPVYIARFQVME